MIGFYDYTVILTYMSLVSSVAGIACAKMDHPLMAIFALLFCGLCDMFDGKVARSKKNRTEDSKRFGIQIDSLCDLVAFGVLPAAICMEIWGENAHKHMIWVGVTAVCALYVLCGLIRLAYFNVTEEIRQEQTDSVRAKYLGLPITSAALILPVVYILRYAMPDATFQAVFTLAMLVVAILFVTPFSIKKPKMGAMMAMLVAGIVIAAILLFASIRAHQNRKAQKIAQPTMAVATMYQREKL